MTDLEGLEEVFGIPAGIVSVDLTIWVNCSHIPTPALKKSLILEPGTCSHVGHMVTRQVEFLNSELKFIVWHGNPAQTFKS